MTDIDREMLRDIYWTIMILKWLIGFVAAYCGYRLMVWWEEDGKHRRD